MSNTVSYSVDGTTNVSMHRAISELANVWLRGLPISPKMVLGLLLRSPRLTLPPIWRRRTSGLQESQTRCISPQHDLGCVKRIRIICNLCIDALDIRYKFIRPLLVLGAFHIPLLTCGNRFGHLCQVKKRAYPTISDGTDSRTSDQPHLSRASVRQPKQSSSHYRCREIKEGTAAEHRIFHYCPT